MMQGANYNFQLTLDPGKVIRQMTKCEVKPKATHSRGINAAMKKNFEKSAKDCLNVQSS